MRTQVAESSSSWGTIELERSVVTGNRAHNDSDPLRANYGGGIYLAGGSFEAVESVISDNVAGRRGGGINGGRTRIYLERTTISGNEALNTTGVDGVGGAMWLDRVDLDILNSTISNNVAESAAGGIFSSDRNAFPDSVLDHRGESKSFERRRRGHADGPSTRRTVSASARFSRGRSLPGTPPPESRPTVPSILPSSRWVSTSTVTVRAGWITRRTVHPSIPTWRRSPRTVG